MEKENVKIKSVKWLGPFIGFDTINGEVCKKGVVGGTDLGIPCYIEDIDSMYLFFGDTFEKPLTTEWRNNVCGYTKDFNLKNGLKLEGFLTNDNEEKAKCLIWARCKSLEEKTKIPTGAIYVDGNIYMYFFSKYSWPRDNVLNENSMNFGGAIKSKDKGKSWERVYDLSWFNHTNDPEDKLLGNSLAGIMSLVLQDVNLQNANEKIDPYTHEGYGFTQIFPVDGKDGYIYILGEGGYRTSGIRLARVKKDKNSIENFEEYYYFNGVENNEPVWLKGSRGLKEVCKKDSYIVKDACGEHSISYNNYLQKWVLTYTKKPNSIQIAFADNIYGPYTTPQVLVDETFNFPNQDILLYGGFTHEKWVEEDGKKMYFVMSQFNVYNSSLGVIEFE